MAAARGKQLFDSDGEEDEKETITFDVFVDSVYDEDSGQIEEDDNTDHEQAGLGEEAADSVLGGGEEARGGGGEAGAGLPAVPVLVGGVGGGGVQAQPLEQGQIK